MTDVLRGEEAPISQCAVKRSGRDQAGYRFDAVAGQRRQPLRHVLELRHAIGSQRKGGAATAVRGTGIALVFAPQFLGHDPPHVVLFWRVADLRDRGAGYEAVGRFRDDPPALAVGEIGDARMVLGEVKCCAG